MDTPAPEPQHPNLKQLAQTLQTRTQLAQQTPSQKEASLRKKGKLSVRKRISLLLDKGSYFLEIGLFAATDMYEAQGGCPSAGVIIGIGKVATRTCVIIANDPTTKAGAWFPMTAKKTLRGQEIAMENRLPIIYLVDSAGVFLPMQDDIFPDKLHFGRLFRNNARLSAMGILQVAAIMGSCVAGGAYLPAMCDETHIVEGTGSLFLAGSYLVRAAVGEKVDNETLGGAHTHTAISGVVDKKHIDEKHCLESIKKGFSMLPAADKAGLNRLQAQPPSASPEAVYEHLPAERHKPYAMQDILESILDKSSMELYKPDYGQTLICGFARLDGWAVGIVANERQTVRTAQGEQQMGGVIYSDAAEKATRFIENCNQRKVPLIFFHDVTGFMVGSRAEHGGIIKYGAKMVQAVANSMVPKYSVLVGNSFGAGNYAMCGRAYDPRLCVAWPSALLGVMGGNAAASTLLQIKLANLETDAALSEEEKETLLTEIRQHYIKTLSPYYAAARLWIDAIILPEETRKVLSFALEMADHGKLGGHFTADAVAN